MDYKDREYLVYKSIRITSFNSLLLLLMIWSRMQQKHDRELHEDRFC